MLWSLLKKKPQEKTVLHKITMQEEEDDCIDLQIKNLNSILYISSTILFE